MSFDISKLAEKVDFGDGEWIDDIDDNPGVRLRVRSGRYKPYVNALGRASRKAGKNGMSDAIFGAILADHLLTGWDFKDGDGPLVLKDGGKIVEYGPDIAATVLTAEDDYGIGNQFRFAVIAAANKVAEGLVAATKEASGN